MTKIPAESDTAFLPRLATTGLQQRRGFVALYLAAWTGAQIALLATAIVSIPLLVSHIDPAHKAVVVAVAATIAATVAIVANPLFGRLSDRSASRYGSRKPFIVGGAIVGGLGLAAVGLFPSIPLLLLFWAIAQLGFASTTAALSALLADQIPRNTRARVSSGLGAAQTLAPVIGSVFVSLVPGLPIIWFLGPAVIAIALNLALAVSMRDLTRTERIPRMNLLTFFATYWVNPRKHPDFAWAWFCRLLVKASIAIVSTYILYFITNAVGVPAARAASSTTIALLTYSFAGLLTIFVLAWVSDRLGRRKVIVVTSGIVTVLGMLVATFAPNFPLVLVGIGIAGMGQGAFLAVDLALMVDVLPNPADFAKDLGVVQMATTLPLLAMPAIALPILALSGDNYRALFFVAALFALAGSLLVIRIKGVR
jgi:MFS family permease